MNTLEILKAEKNIETGNRLTVNSLMQKLHAAVEAASIEVIGKNPIVAANLCTNLGLRCRSVSVDGKAQIITRDCRSDRVGLVIENGVITATQNG